ncbi:AbiTii domain-containing protein [Rhodococcoides fascians]|uniref:AbiTii domain-containing protein n=1 Tax=Rhodococcoides fascians TaxID=1828 RepID=UPI00277F8F5E|nr:hypothetical protein [Rhodococcus fascians]MDQ0284784.1 hypothetical protein [Rhodococcus fascians]
MTLLERIIIAAESDVPIPSLLRMMKSLASRTGATKLEKWANQELVGYPSGVAVPGYRGPFEMQVYATFRNSFRQIERDVPIASGQFPDELKKDFFSYTFREPVAEIEAYVIDPTELSWSADTVNAVDRMFEAGLLDAVRGPSWRMTAAAGHVAKSRMIGILDQVRTAAHALALEVEQLVPTAGEPTASPDDNKKAAIYISNFNFSNANLSGSNNAFNSSQFSQNITTPTRGDADSLEQALSEAGVSTSDIGRLMDAIAEDPDEPTGGVGHRVSDWLKEQAAMVIPAVATVVAQSVYAFYGIPIES